ncbi:MAG: M20 family metallopeptidase [Chloroflexota bacterium]|nr:M20 family metallopeptidase [Chloroflexota bacterium]MDE3192775.1 M20 family metallopeptidase [Chloroflexota bacterium]
MSGISAGDLREDLLALSRGIHSEPELAYQETRAVDRISALLERHGHRVERPYGGLATSFRARIGPSGPAVTLLAEYDALPGIGHACGHNLIAMTNAGAFLVAARQAERLPVGIELVGTPAEESGGGKLDLIDAGAFKGSVAVLSSHPGGGGGWECGNSSLGIVEKSVAFRGLASHAAYSPERGRNALNGVIRLFVGVDGWRQHLPREARIHGVITDGGGPASNIIPAHAEAKFGIRAATIEQLREMERTFEDIARGAALQTGTEVEVAEAMRLYAPVRPHPRLTALLQEELRSRGIEPQAPHQTMASTDLGNVSEVVPTDHVGFPVTKEKIAGHSNAMRDASATDLAHQSAFTVVDVLAAAAVRIATDATLRSELTRAR